MPPRWISYGLFFAVVCTVWVSTTYYLVSRFLRSLGAEGQWTSWCKLVFVVLSFSYVLGRALDHFDGPGWITGPLTSFGAYFVGTVSIALTLFVAAEVVVAVCRVGQWAGNAELRAGIGLLKFLVLPLPRLLAAGLGGVVALLCILAYVLGGLPPVVNRVEIAAPPGTTLAERLRVVHLSDLHLGRLFGAERLAPAIDKVNALDPDLVVISGDLFDEDSRVVDDCLPILARLKPRLGVYVSTGNHEEYVGMPYVADRLAVLGFHLLRQEWKEVMPGLVVAGVDDHQVLKGAGLSDEQGLARALSGIPAGSFTILLSHRPNGVGEAVGKGASLVLAGHTHGGQVPPFQLLTPLANEGYLQGLYPVGAGFLYVSAGTGTWGPRMRLLSQAEIVEIAIQPAIE
jgi:predicted MPP superfamily phosphohydrolase